MRRAATGCLLTLLLAGCQTPERAAVQPLPPDAPPLPYSEAVTRARLQVSAAQEFFYRDSWLEVTQAADAIKETAGMLAKFKPEEVPAKQRDHLAKNSKELSDAATALHASGQAQDVIKTTDAMQRLHLAVRALRPD